MTAQSYHFALQLHADGRAVGVLPLERGDFARAAEAAFFAALRAGRVRDYAPSLDRAHLAPHGGGFEATLPLPSGDATAHFGIDYFKTFARRHGARLVLAGALAPGAALAVRLVARPGGPTPRPRRGLAISLEEEPAIIPVRDGHRRAHGPTEAWDAPAPEDLPVLIPRHVLDEAVADARQAPDREVGGVLLGHLCRDADDGALYLEVTCAVPCEGTRATEVSVTFTHETWARVREVTQLRGEGELIVGWVHSHPFRLCGECPLPLPAECLNKVLFYSGDDEFLMETAFARPFMVGLLTAVEPRLEAALGHLPVKLFGWRDGVIVPRGFEVIP